MTSTAPTRRFWTTLAGSNAVILAYPIIMFIRTGGDTEQFLAAMILMVVLFLLFLLFLIDTFAITLAYALCQ